MKLKTAKNIDIDMEQFKNSKYGEFTTYVRENIDPLWGYNNSGIVMNKYNIKLIGYKTVPVETTIDVLAPNEELAKTEALSKDIYNLDWEDSYHYGDDDIKEVEIDYVTLIDSSKGIE
jgi:hypothetical protein